MKSMLRAFLAALSLAACLPAGAAPYPDGPQLRDAIARGAEVLAGVGMEVEVRDAQAEGLPLSLLAAGLDLDSGRCVVYFSAAPAEFLRPFFSRLDPADLPLWLGAIAVHEAAHCVEQREAYQRRRFAKVLPPGVPDEGMTLQAYVSVVRSGAVETWGEALGDIASVLYLREAAPARWRDFARGFAGLRRELAASHPEHDTTAWLDGLLAEGADIPGTPLFDAAFELRRRLQPPGKG